MSYLSGAMVLILADLSVIHKYKWLLDNPLQNLRVKEAHLNARHGTTIELKTYRTCNIVADCLF